MSTFSPRGGPICDPFTLDTVMGGVKGHIVSWLHLTNSVSTNTRVCGAAVYNAETRRISIVSIVCTLTRRMRELGPAVKAATRGDGSELPIALISLEASTVGGFSVLALLSFLILWIHLKHDEKQVLSLVSRRKVQNGNLSEVGVSVTRRWKENPQPSYPFLLPVPPTHICRQVSLSDFVIPHQYLHTGSTLLVRIHLTLQCTWTTSIHPLRCQSLLVVVNLLCLTAVRFHLRPWNSCSNSS